MQHGDLRGAPSRHPANLGKAGDEIAGWILAPDSCSADVAMEYGHPETRSNPICRPLHEARPEAFELSIVSPEFARLRIRAEGRASSSLESRTMKEARGQVFILGVLWRFCARRGSSLLPECFALQFLPTGEQPIEFLLGFSMCLVRGV